ncbi:Essential protein Yae1, N terminal [Xylographa trunciseda]|nr:Essential protein Yae1, N terminal [Xylographa trunciseda]
MLISTPPHSFSPPLPPTTPPPPTQPPQSDLLSDIFSSSPSPPPSRTPHPHDPDSHHTTHPSDIPRLRSQHSTAGYREGLSASKPPALQPGFDEGYTLGAVLGLKVGELLGVLDGVAAALQAGRGAKGSRERKGATRGEEPRAQGRGLEVTNAATGAVDQAPTDYERIARLRRQAAAELDLQRVFGAEFWGADGLWSWAVPGPTTEGGAGDGMEPGKDADDDVTFEEVAAAHPLIREWSSAVEEVMREWGLEREVWAGDEWEAGRVDEGA